MLQSLTIHNFVIVSHQELEFSNGFSVLSGETGAGKSILIDAVHFALGARVTNSLLKDPSQKMLICMTVDGTPESDHLLTVNGLLPDDSDQNSLTIRRVLQPDGKSRAFINDQPISMAVLKEFASIFIHFHGQFEDITSIAAQKSLIERFGKLSPLKSSVKEAFQKWAAARKNLADLQRALKKLLEEEEFLNASLQELKAFAPEPGEEDSLLERRKRLKDHERIVQELSEAHKSLKADPSVLERLQKAMRHLGKVSDAPAAALSEKLDQVLDQVHSIQDQLEELQWSILHEQDLSLDDLESRLFQLRSLARKHQITPDELPALSQKLETQFNQLQHKDQDMAEAQKQLNECHDVYKTLAQKLKEARLRSADKLSKLVTKEFPALKLEKVKLQPHQTDLPVSEWGMDGIDQIEFHIQTNPGSPFASLRDTASGGELSRIMLAIKVVTGPMQQAPTMIFDEIDKGIGGAVAAAVGKRLLSLSTDRQVLAITHAPQVAAYANHHWHVSKQQDQDTTHARVALLETTHAREEEIARMLAGETITDQARAAAKQLLAEKTD